MTRKTTLKLTGSREFSGRENDAGEVVDIVFWVDAEQVASTGVAHVARQRSFLLRAVRSDHAAGEDLDRELSGEPGNRGTFPLPVYKQNLAPGETIADHVRRLYLDPNQPDAINDAAQFLIPADLDNNSTPPPFPLFRGEQGDFNRKPAAA